MRQAGVLRAQVGAVGELRHRALRDPEHGFPPSSAQSRDHPVRHARQIAQRWRRGAHGPVVDPDEHEQDECRGADQGSPGGMRREQAIERPHLEREKREAEEADQWHLEDFQALEEWDRVDPAATRHGIERFPHHPGEEACGHEPCDASPAAPGDIRKQRVRGIAPVQQRLGDEPHRTPGERVEIARENQHSR